MKNTINKDEKNMPLVLFLDDDPIIIDMDLNSDEDNYDESFKDIAKYGLYYAGGLFGAIALGRVLVDGIKVDKTDALVVGGSALVGFKLIKSGYKSLNMSRNKRNKGKELKLIKE